MDNKKIVLSIFKCAEDGNGYIARLFNSSNETVSCNVKAGFKFENAYDCNLNEDNLYEIKACGNVIGTVFEPWGIKTLKFN